MVGVLSLSAVYRGFEPRSGPTKDDKIGMCSFSAKYATYIYIERAKTGWLASTMLCPIGATCLSVDYCFSELAL